MEYRVAATVEEALALLGGRDGSRPVAGGTDLAVVLADGLAAPPLLVDVAGIPALRGVRRTADGIAIGPATTIAEIAARPDLPACLCQGARAIGSPQIRNLATVGGNVCNASPCGDTLSPLVALDAAFVLASRSGTRTVPAEQFFVGPKKTVLRPGELLVEIRIAPARLAGRSAFRMIGKRNGQVISQVNAAVWLALEGGVIREARVAVGSVAPVPLRLKAAEALLAGRSARGLDVEPVLARADAEIAPISDVRASLEYRRLVTGSLLRDALLEAAGI
ncbi:MAG: xanthine dehydrogenase family protein subunit M [Spirochaetes bacterium]|nr:xanthine dehydrogenase family protein subunit M [Spirochaetota bacterium]